MALQVIKNNENNGPTIKNGKFVMITGVDAAMQIIASAIRTQLGEYQYSKTRGVEYFDNAFNANPNYQQFEFQVRKIVTGFSFVEKITDFTYTKENDVLKYSLTVQTVYGTDTVTG